MKPDFVRVVCKPTTITFERFIALVLFRLGFLPNEKQVAWTFEEMENKYVAKAKANGIIVGISYSKLFPDQWACYACVEGEDLCDVKIAIPSIEALQRVLRGEIEKAQYRALFSDLGFPRTPF